jgi:NitT/TauT family transport system permease protein
VLFGAALIALWEGVTRGFNVPSVLLPAPSMIWGRILSSTHILWADFQQTYLKAVIAGYVMGCGIGFHHRDPGRSQPVPAQGRHPGRQSGRRPADRRRRADHGHVVRLRLAVQGRRRRRDDLLPDAGQHVAGLAATGSMERDLMRTYAASRWQTLFKLRLPAAMPFIFNALKINSTLALIGAIVAEFFGTPIVGMGFRISTEVGRMNVDMVWATIFVAALAGSLSYGLIALAERAVTFWHPSYRRRAGA